MCNEKLNDGTNAAHSTTSRVKPINSYQLRVNSSFVPAKPITDDPVFFIEILLACHNDIFSLHNKASISSIDYFAAHGTNTGLNSFKNKFIVATDLTQNHGRDGYIQQGVRTLDSPVFSDVILSQTLTTTLFMLTLAEYDMIYQIEDGVCKVRF